MTSPSARDIANMPITRWHPIIDVTCICMHTCVTHTGGHLGTLECLHQHVYNFSTHTCMHTVRVPPIHSSSHTQQQPTMKRNIGAVTCMHKKKPCRRRSEYARARRASWACDRQRAPLPAPKCAPRPVSPPRWLSALNSRGSRLYIIHLYNS